MGRKISRVKKWEGERERERRRREQRDPHHCKNFYIYMSKKRQPFCHSFWMIGCHTACM